MTPWFSGIAKRSRARGECQRSAGGAVQGDALMARVWVALFSLASKEDVENFTDRDLVQTFPADRLVWMQLVEVAAPDPPAG